MRLLFLLITFTAAAWAQTDIRPFPVETLQKLGVAIYEQDVRVARASDLLMAGKFDAEKEGLRGWIVEDDGRTMLVRFVREKSDKLEAFADVRFGAQHETKLEQPTDRTLTAAQLARYRASQLASENIKRPCSANYNIVTLADPEHDGLLVYALAATTDPDSILFGGHYRFSISSDGEKIVRADELFRSCLTVSKNPGKLPKGSAVEELSVTTLVSRTPVETHVFLSLLHKLPLLVITSDASVWRVEGGRMARTD